MNSHLTPALLLLTMLLAGSAISAPVMPPYSGPAPKIRVGVASTDGTGFLGASGGQYSALAQKRGLVFNGSPCVYVPDPVDSETCDGAIDPHGFSSSKLGTYGVQSRLTIRALAIEGGNGQRIVLLKTDHYLAQDIFLRRVGQILDEGASGVSTAQILQHATHNHSSPYQLTQSAGVWVFQDAYNAIAFEHAARMAALAIEQAVRNLRPARMGATSVPFNIVKGNVVGTSQAASYARGPGTPAGYPRDYGDDKIVVLRFDDLSNPALPQPLAIWMNHGQHPESLDGYHLVSRDYLAPLERFVERDTGALLVFSQGDVGSAEGPGVEREDRGRADTPNRILPAGPYEGVFREWAHTGYAQTERAGRILADAVIQGYNDIGDGAASVTVPYTTDFPVDFYDYWVVGPISHPRPTVGNCLANPSDPSVPVAPTCESSRRAPFRDLPPAPNVAPTPAHYGNQGHPAVEENTRIRLQALRLGEVLLASCACEAQVDLILNLETRTDNVANNRYDGFDWACLLPQHVAEPVCLRQKEFYDPAVLPAIPGNNFSTMGIAHLRAQVHNDATGWDAPQNAAAAESQEPADITQIWGNFSWEELPPALGYKLPVGIGHAGDYNGYTVSYREYMSRDHYRKALTAYGPHTADYMVTRLVRMARAMKDPAYSVPPEPNAANGDADEQRQEAQARSVGQQSSEQYDARYQSSPDDPGAAAILVQPQTVERYRAATLQWRGGSNAVDNPQVRVERRIGAQWLAFGDQSGEVQTLLNFPTATEEAAARGGQFEWKWTASFEAFQPFPASLNNGTPAGEYRFVVDGAIRKGGANLPYHLESASFTVLPWSGIAVSDYARDSGGDVSFRIPAYNYPRSYTSPFLVIGDDGRQITACKTCTFRPWAKSGTPQSALVRVTRANGAQQIVTALRGADGVWRADTNLRPGETAQLPRGGVLDNNQEINNLSHTVQVPVSTTSPPVPALSLAPTTQTKGLLVTLSASATDADNHTISVYRFDCGAAGATLQHADPASGSAACRYPRSGRYTATVSATDSSGQTSASPASASVTITNTAPSADLAADPASGRAPLTVRFDASGSNDPDSANTNDRVQLYHFDFGDGTVANDSLVPVVTHTYAARGSYNARVRVADNEGLASSNVALLLIEVGGNAPVARLAAPASQSKNRAATLDASPSSDADGDALTEYTFNFGDGSAPLTQAGAIVQHPYAAGGQYQATVTVRDATGERSTVSRPVTVVITNTAPTAALSASPASGAGPLTVNFSAAGSGDPDPGDRVVFYRFEFGDGSAAVSQAGPTVAHTYARRGQYAAHVTASDTEGLASTPAGQLIEVLNRTPIARLVANPDAGPAPLDVILDGSDSGDTDGDVLTYRYDFGDGSTPETGAAAPTHRYTTAGTYTVHLTVTDSQNASHQARRVITVSVAPGVGDNRIFGGGAFDPRLLLLLAALFRAPRLAGRRRWSSSAAGRLRRRSGSDAAGYGAAIPAVNVSIADNDDAAVQRGVPKEMNR